MPLEGRIPQKPADVHTHQVLYAEVEMSAAHFCPAPPNIPRA